MGKLCKLEIAEMELRGRRKWNKPFGRIEGKGEDENERLGGKYDE